MTILTNKEYQERVKGLWDRIKRDFPNAMIVEIRDPDGRAWPIPLLALLNIYGLPKVAHMMAEAMAPPGLAEANKNAVRDAQEILDHSKPS